MMNVPDWFSQGALYQINPRTFSKEGTIAAVTKELSFIAELGFSVVYLCPIFEEDDSADVSHWSERQKASETGNPKNPYRMMDYFSIDSEYGTDAELKAFVKEAHRLGMRVMLDLVYLHIGPHAYILQQHPEFAQHNEDGSIKYSRWMFPYLNFDYEGLREYLWCNMVYYVSVFDVDGFRCDVGDGIPLDFWNEGKRRICAIKPDAVLLNEGRKYEYLLGGFDACYCFDWHSGVYDVIVGKKTVSELVEKMREIAQKVPQGGLLMRDMDNHDTVTDWSQRIETLVGHEGMEMILAATYLMDGVPMVYCGNELADDAKLSMFANRFHMGKFSVTEREALKKTEVAQRRGHVMQILNALQRKSLLLSRGATEWLTNDHPETVLSFRRVFGEQSAMFVGNMSREAVTVSVAGLKNDDKVNIVIQNGLLDGNNAINLDAYGYLVIKKDEGGSL